MNESRQSSLFQFWKQALALRGSVTPKVLPAVLEFGLIAAVIQLLYEYFPQLAIPIGPLEVSGGVIGVLLVLRFNAGYDRWWEARKLWGGIVNQSRNLVISALAYGPQDSEWRKRFVRLVVSFADAARSSLRGRE